MLIYVFLNISGSIRSVQWLNFILYYRVNYSLDYFTKNFIIAYLYATFLQHLIFKSS